MRALAPLLLVLTGAALFLPTVVRAELGGSAATVSTDRARMGARLATSARGSYTRHELTRTNGGSVHELTNAAGQVFAVTWAGPGKPDLRTLLGKYFNTYQTAGAGIGRTMHALRRPPRVDQIDLKILTGGHMGFFHGVAVVPSLAPAGFDTAALAAEQ